MRNRRDSQPRVSWRHAAQPLQRTDLFALVLQLGLRFEPQLEQLDRLLDKDELFARVRDDLARRHSRARSRGRPSTPVGVILRMLVVLRLYSWSSTQAEFFVNDSLVRRQFCRVDLERVPDDTTPIRRANTIGPETLQALNDRAVQLAWSLKVIRGRKLGVGTTAVETNIHFPTDSGLLGDGVRVVSRLLRRAKAARQFGRAPDLLAADCGIASAAHERLAQKAGVKHEARPCVGKAPPSRWAEVKGERLRRGSRFRAGIAGRIPALNRDRGLKRCRSHGGRGFGRWVGWGMLAHNGSKIAGAGTNR